MSTAEHLLAYVDDAALERARAREEREDWTPSIWALLGLPEHTRPASTSLLAYLHPNDVLRAFDRMKPGSWRDVVTLPHEEVQIGSFIVPAYTWEDEERARWRRRKWWGRHTLAQDADGRWWRRVGGWGYPHTEPWKVDRGLHGPLTDTAPIRKWWPS